MKRTKSRIRAGIVGSLLLLTCASTVDALTYRYDFIVTSVDNLTLLSPPLLQGSYLDLTAATGTLVLASTGVADWNIIAPKGTLNNSDSSQASGISQISWNSSTLTAGGVGYDDPSTGETVTLFSDKVVYTTPSGRGIAFGFWQADSSSVPEASATIGLLGLGLAGLFALRRGVACSQAT
jgi:hypothetical protein